MKKLLVPIAAVVIACSTDAPSSTDGGGDAATEASIASACDQAGQVKLWGKLDTTALDQTYDSRGGSFAAGTLNLRFGNNVYFGEASGSIHITLNASALRLSGTPIASGWIWMPREGPYPNAVFCIGGGTLGGYSNGYTFTLTDLSRTPVDGVDAFTDAGACVGSPVEGEVTGCSRSPK